ncbi:MAG: hypothetical protein ACK58T_44720 [Phycisphaerae bacterium]|jgi:hypothetical protein
MDNVEETGLIDDIANGFWSTPGHVGAHTAAYLDDSIEVRNGRATREAIIEGIDFICGRILAGAY